MPGPEPTRAERFKRFQDDVGFLIFYLRGRGFSDSEVYNVFVPPSRATIVDIVEAMTRAAFMCGAAYARAEDAGFSLQEITALRDTIERTARRFARDHMKNCP